MTFCKLDFINAFIWVCKCFLFNSMLLLMLLFLSLIVYCYDDAPLGESCILI